LSKWMHDLVQERELCQGLPRLLDSLPTSFWPIDKLSK
jgi:hypothetical protein